MMDEPNVKDAQFLVEVDERIRRIQFDLEELSRAQKELFADGEVKAAEQKYHETLAVQEAAMKERAIRLEKLDNYKSEVVDRQHTKIQNTKSGAQKHYGDVMEEGTRLRNRCTEDMNNLVEAVNKVNEDHNDYMVRYQSEMERSELFLKDTQKKQVRGGLGARFVGPGLSFACLKRFFCTLAPQGPRLRTLRH